MSRTSWESLRILRVTSRTILSASFSRPVSAGASHSCACTALFGRCVPEGRANHETG
jgi:hypothetical protein